MTLQSGTVFGPTATSPSTQAFVTDPSMGPGYPVVQNPVASIATAGPPSTTLPNPEAMSNVTAVLTSVLNNETINGSCPVLGPASLVSSVEAQNSIPTGGAWVVISNTAGAELTQQFTSLGGPNSGTPEAASPSPSSNQTLGESGTEQRLSVLGVDSAQQGTSAISNVTAITASFGGVSGSAIQVFRWS